MPLLDPQIKLYISYFSELQIREKDSINDIIFFSALIPFYGTITMNSKRVKDCFNTITIIIIIVVKTINLIG
jgi:hypothetical protein